MKASFFAFVVLVILLSTAQSQETAPKAVALEHESTSLIRFLKKLRKKAKRFIAKTKAKVKRAITKGTSKLTKLLVKKRKLEGALVVKKLYHTQLRYVALGDSFAAGVGAGGGPLGLYRLDFDKCCARNRNAYPSLLSRQLGVSSFHFRACMGARALKGPNNVLRQIQGTPRNAQLVTVTIGGNDMGFEDVIYKCITSFVAQRRCLKAINRGIRRSKTVIGPHVRVLQRILRQRYPRAIIVFTGYPIPYSHRRRKLICHNKKVRLAINGLVAVLNQNIRANVDNFVPVSFAGRQLCGKRRPWINAKLRPAVRVPAKCSASRKGYVDRTGGFYHPTAGGALRYSHSILAWYFGRSKTTSTSPK